jgi:hypothetical protein
MEVKMQPIITILSFALLIWIEPANAQSTFLVSVSRHTGIVGHNGVPLDLTEDDIKKILDDASKLLQKPGHVGTDDKDVQCDVTFTLKGEVGTFGSSDKPKIVDTKTQLDAIHSVDSDPAKGNFHVKVVERINFCRPELQGQILFFYGCAFSPPNFRSIIVVHPKTHTNPSNLSGPALATFPVHLEWAHEFGHLTGLPHRDDHADALMTRCSLNTQFANVSDARVRVTKEECASLRAGPGQQAAAPLQGSPTNCR